MVRLIGVSKGMFHPWCGSELTMVRLEEAYPREYSILGVVKS
jgi:hypothetical protein